MGNPRQYASPAQVIVNCIRNEYTPEFLPTSSYSVRFDTNVPANSVILGVTVQDRDTQVTCVHTCDGAHVFYHIYFWLNHFSSMTHLLTQHLVLHKHKLMFDILSVELLSHFPELSEWLWFTASAIY